MDWEETGLLDDLTPYQAEVASNHLNYYQTAFDYINEIDSTKKIAAEHYKNILFALTSILCFKNIYFEEQALLTITSNKIKANPQCIAKPAEFIAEIISEISFETNQKQL
jgi:hypothetical protein